MKKTTATTKSNNKTKQTNKKHTDKEGEEKNTEIEKAIKIGFVFTCTCIIEKHIIIPNKKRNVSVLCFT